MAQSWRGAAQDTESWALSQGSLRWPSRVMSVHRLTLTGTYSQKSAELHAACAQSTAPGEGAQPSLRREETAVSLQSGLKAQVYDILVFFFFLNSHSSSLIGPSHPYSLEAPLPDKNTSGWYILLLGLRQSGRGLIMRTTGRLLSISEPSVLYLPGTG